jgi:hypothetical protein
MLQLRPKEDCEEGECGLLEKATCGTRDAAQNWEMECAETTVEAGFRQGLCSVRVFYHEEKNVRVVVRGDDFAVLGLGKSLDWFRGIAQEERMEVKFETRMERGKPGAVRILNRVAAVAGTAWSTRRTRGAPGS